MTGSSLIRLLLVTSEVDKIMLKDLMKDFDFHPKERFLVYGFLDFFNQLKTVQERYYILFSNPYPMILIELDDIDQIQILKNHNLSTDKYYNVQHVI